MNAARAWPIAIVAVLAITVGANAMLVWKASDENGAAIEPDYYRKAVSWDSTLAHDEASRALGWTSEAHLARAAGGAELTVLLREADGRPLEGARLVVAAIHNRAGGRFATATLTPRAPGIYGARLPAHHLGRWEVRIDAGRAHDRYTTILHVELAP